MRLLCGGASFEREKCQVHLKQDRRASVDGVVVPLRPELGRAAGKGTPRKLLRSSSSRVQVESNAWGQPVTGLNVSPLAFFMPSIASAGVRRAVVLILAKDGDAATAIENITAMVVSGVRR